MNFSIARRKVVNLTTSQTSPRSGTVRVWGAEGDLDDLPAGLDRHVLDRQEESARLVA